MLKTTKKFKVAIDLTLHAMIFTSFYKTDEIVVYEKRIVYPVGSTHRQNIVSFRVYIQSITSLP